MTIIIPEESGFCPGVKRADRKILELAQNHPHKKIYVAGPLINNQNYINYLRKKGIITVNKTEDIPDGEWAVIRTHGLPRKVREELEKRCSVLDLTCPKVKKVQEEITHWADQGYFLVLNGKKDHPETLGLLSFSSQHILVTKNGDNEALYDKLNSLSRSNTYKGLFFTSQTTGHQATFIRLLNFAGELKQQGRQAESYQSICPVIAKKEERAVTLQRDCRVSIIIGDPTSSNANRLFMRLKESKENSYFVQDIEDLKSQNIPFKSDDNVLIVSSASTPPFIQDEIEQYLQHFQF